MRDLSPGKLVAELELLRKSPEQYIEMISGVINQNLNDPSGYFSRAQGWERIGHLDKALDDFDKSIALKDRMIARLRRGSVLTRVGRRREALEDFNRAESLEPEGWIDCWGPLHRADCHARLGNEAAALADCERLPEEFWSPGIYGEPGGNKTEITAEVRRRARAAKGLR